MLATMRVLVGTSGFGYKGWRPAFYPEDLPDSGMLGFYARRFGTVEINNTFYRMPTKTILSRWMGEVPEGFSFVLKAAQRITHQKRLSATAAEDLAHFFETASVLGPLLGPVLFQLPPFLKKDAARLRDFLALLPPGRRAAFEFRHASWFDDEIYDALRARGAALCSADTDESGDSGASVVPTASWGYLRLRRENYGEGDLATWAERVEAQPWEDAYVFFKHEEEGKAPRLAETFRAALR
ncbi:MAG TPA: DUF72 domain-containing protein [Vicinamibacteria bacterium]